MKKKIKKKSLKLKLLNKALDCKYICIINIM